MWRFVAWRGVRVWLGWGGVAARRTHLLHVLLIEVVDVNNPFQMVILVLEQAGFETGELLLELLALQIHGFDLEPGPGSCHG